MNEAVGENLIVGLDIGTSKVGNRGRDQTGQ